MKIRSVFLSSVCTAAFVFAPVGLRAYAQESAQTAFAGVFQAETQTETCGDFVKYEYPVLRGIDAFDQAVVDSINSHFREEAVSIARSEAENLEASRQEILEYNPDAANSLAYEVTCDSLYLDSGIFSVMQFHYTYSGGAHGYSFPVGTSFDLSTGEELSMAELLGCDEATAQEAVVEAYREHIIGQVENITEESIRDSFDIMEYWKTADGMYVNIAPYNVASYAAGQQQALGDARNRVPSIRWRICRRTGQRICGQQYRRAQQHICEWQYGRRGSVCFGGEHYCDRRDTGSGI